MDPEVSDEQRILEQEFQIDLYTYKALCRRVVDGDTLDLDIDLGLDAHRYERVRLFGIDTPETYGVKKDSEEYQAGMKAKGRVAELVTSRELWVRTHQDKTGKYGRYLATVWVVVDDALVCVNKLLVTEGLAEYRSY